MLNGQKVWSTNSHTAEWGSAWHGRTRTRPSTAESPTSWSTCRVRASPSGNCGRPTAATCSTRSSSTTCSSPTTAWSASRTTAWKLARTTLGNERLSIGTGLNVGGESPAQIAQKHRAGGPDVELSIGTLAAGYSTLDAMAQRIVVRSLNGLEPAPDGAVLEARPRPDGRPDRRVHPAVRGHRRCGRGRRVDHADVRPRVFIGGGTVEMQLNMIGERILGLPGPRSQ